MNQSLAFELSHIHAIAVEHVHQMSIVLLTRLCLYTYMYFTWEFF